MISIYAPNATDFSNNGLSLLLPIECTIEEQANGMYELTLVHPITGDLRWAQIQNGCIIKADAPKRESPLYEVEAIESGETTATVTRKLYRVDVNTRLRLRAKPNTSSKILGRYKDGTEVVQLQDMGNGWYHVMIRKGGATGYMSANYLDYVKTITETVTTTKPVTRQGISVQPAREQLFRIYSTEVNTDAHTVTAKAMHVFYDLRGNPVGKAYAPEGADANAAAREVFGAALIANDFELHSHLSGTVTGDYGFKSLPECLLDPDEGIVTQTGGMLVRDNFDVFLLPDAVRDMGVTIRRGKNLIGVTVETDMTDVVTRIIPVGTNKKGNDLFLDGTIYVDSPRIGNYPHPLAKRIDYDVKVGDGDGQFSTEKKAREELTKRAQADFDAGVDLPTYGMEVDFILLGNTAEYAEYASLQAVHLFDTVTVIDELIGLRAKLRVTGYKWDVLGARYESVTLGELQDLQQTTYGYTLAPGTISGSKLVANSVGSTALRDLSIQYAKIAHAAIEQLTADSITAVRAHIHDLVAGNITTDQLYADFAKIATLEVAKATFDYANIKNLDVGVINALIGKFDEITAGKLVTDELYAAFADIINLSVENLEADKLSAALGNFVTMYAGTGEFDFATIKNLVAKAMALEQGSMYTVYIRNLAVTSANLLSATLGKLVIKGDDGKYYRVFVTSTGEIRTEEVTVSSGEINAGQTSTGQQILETTLNVGNLNAETIQGSSAVINEILTIALNAEKITAADALIASATITELYATTIKAIGDSLDLSANESIKLMVSRKSANFYQADMPEVYNVGDWWICAADGTQYIAVGLVGRNKPEVVIKNALELMYRFSEDADDYLFAIDDDGNLRANESVAEITEDGELYSELHWRRLRVSELKNSYIDIANEYIRISTGGILDVLSGAAHFRTADYVLSILSDDGTEDTIMDFDTESRVLRVDEIQAGNVRPFIPGTTEVYAGMIGGLDGLAGMLSRAKYEHVVYHHNVGDYSTEPVLIENCDSLCVEITDVIYRRIPPIIIRNAVSNFYIENVEWNCEGANALEIDSGSLVMKNCKMTARNGVVADRHARVTWIGADSSLESVGSCGTDAFRATLGAEIKLNGMLPTGMLTQDLGGMITAINTSVGGGMSGAEQGKTVTLAGSIGYYGTANGWHGGEMYQGYSNGKGRIYGCMKFTLPSDVSMIKSATLTIERNAYAGSGGNVNLAIYGSETEYGSRPTLGNMYIQQNKAIGTGDKRSFDVTQAAQDMLAGNIRQLVLYTGETAAASGKTYSAHYAKFNSAALKITY